MTATNNEDLAGIPEVRDRIAQETAEYIAATLAPTAPPGDVVYPTGQRPPSSVAEIQATLLDGRLWISWMDDRVIEAMHMLHGKPTGDVTHLIDEDWPPVAQPGCGVIPERDRA